MSQSDGYDDGVEYGLLRGQKQRELLRAENERLRLLLRDFMAMFSEIDAIISNEQTISEEQEIEDALKASLGDQFADEQKTSEAK